ncbi:hypothetical protein O3P69_013939 [Scylla paramamosain]|uniref:Uncharacterized protein n=1 Tax=Scylla paramamosain TaxID=85552 RepID=A0AAW0SQF3_SCYPA
MTHTAPATATTATTRIAPATTATTHTATAATRTSKGGGELVVACGCGDDCGVCWICQLLGLSRSLFGLDRQA